MNRLNGAWKRSSRSTSSGNCVEVRRAEDRVQVRDSKNPKGHILIFTPADWDTFINSTKEGGFSLNI